MVRQQSSSYSQQRAAPDSGFRSRITKRSMSTNLQEVLAEYQDLGQRAKLRINRRVARLRGQAHRLERVANNQQAPSTVRQLASAIAVYTHFDIENYDRFISEIDAWNDSVGAELAVARAENLVQPADAAGRARVAAIRQRFSDIEDGLLAMNDMNTVAANTRFLEQHQAYHQLPPSGGMLPRVDLEGAAPGPADGGAGGAAGGGTDGGAGGAVGGLGGVSAQLIGIPENIRTYQDAYRADPAVQAAFFDNGSSVGGDMNRRLSLLPQSGYVVASAHVLELDHSNDSDLARAGSVVLGAAVGALGGPLGAVAGGVALGTTFSVARPYDLVGQGYTLEYYAPGALRPWAVNYIWGERQSSAINIAVSVHGERDPHRMANLASDPASSRWSWWRFGSAPLRTPMSPASIAGVLTPGRMRRSAEWPAKHLAAQQLIQAGASFGAAANEGGVGTLGAAMGHYQQAPSLMVA